ncbi:MAG: hypothetical protein M3Q23_12645 [Actinomycetota bacterium]|nr:hypothetical protein [Actinomycetota bacterium]
MEVQYGYRARPVVIRHPSYLGSMSRYLVAATGLGLLATAVWVLSLLFGSASTVVR